MTSIDQLRGLLIPVATVFDHQGNVDEAVFRELIRFYVDSQVNALFFLGSFGQGPALDITQRKRVAEIATAEVNGRVPVAIHIGAVDPYTSIELGIHARSIGADALAVVGPYYYADRSHDETVMHFQMVDEAVQMPLFVYNNPPYQGFPITMALMQRLVKAVPRIFGAKLAMGGIDEALSYVRAIPGFGPFILASGLMPGMLMGVRGTISPPLTILPELGVALVRAIDERRIEEAVRLQILTTEVNETMIRLQRKYGRDVQAEGLRALGFDVKKFPRWPTTPVPPEGRKEVRELIESVRTKISQTSAAYA